MIIRFAAAGTYPLQSELLVPSNTTIDARGLDISITHKGLVLRDVSNVIVTGLTFVDIDGPGDSLQIHRSEKVLVDHCTFTNPNMVFSDDDHIGPDEQISIIEGSTDITIQWSWFQEHDKVLLAGNGNYGAEIDGQIKLTLHHNFFDGTSRRHPFLRYGKADIFNCLFRNWSRRIWNKSPYGVRSSTGAQILLEANVFEQDHAVFRIGAYVENGGKLKAIHNLAEDIHLFEREADEVFSRPYSVTVESATAAFAQTLPFLVGSY
jgi:pectate lyase